MRHTSEASRALLRARTFNEMLEVQAKLLRDNMQAFLDQSVRVAEFGEPYGDAPPGGIEGGEYRAAAKLAVARWSVGAVRRCGRSPGLRRTAGWVAARL